MKCSTQDLPHKNATDDIEILKLSVDQNLTIISKDADFYKHFILKGQPPKLLYLTIGNMLNHELMSLFENNFYQIEVAIEQNKVVELSNHEVTVHF